MSEPPKRFRVAFSFAGEKREFVEKVAAILAGRFCPETILYDKYHEAEFGRDELDTHLTRLYRGDSDLIVVVFCREYEEKKWCGLEWKTIRGILSQGRKEPILLTRFDRVEPEMLEGLAGFIDLDEKSPWKTATLILERLALNEGLPKDYYTQIAPSPLPGPWPPPCPATTSIPHNLPSLQPFFGREEELAKIADALKPENRGWGALIDGPGGMGKTSLAVRAAYDASPEVFKKIIFVSLKTRELDDDGVRDLSGFILSGLAELFGKLAHELGRPEILKAAEEQRPRLLLDALRGTQSLLLLDNLESLLKKERDTVFTFVKILPAGCKAILTCRGRIGSGAEELILEKLSEAAALATLAELATHNPLLAKTSEAERLVLYRETGGKPLLLRWTAGQLGRGHCLTFTDALHFIRSCPEGNDPLEFIFNDLVVDFTPEEVQILSALTYFTLAAKVAHLAALAQLSEAATTRALHSLTNRSLAVPSDEMRAFSLVPLVADFLRKTKPEVVTETGDRLEKHAHALILENGFVKFRQFPILDEAWPAIAPALPRFAAKNDTQFQKICEALKFFLEFSGRWDEGLSLSKQAEERAKAMGDLANAGWRASDAGWLHVRRGEPDAVLDCADRALLYWSAPEVRSRGRAVALRLRGEGFVLAENYRAAIESYDEAVAFSRTIGPETIDVALGLECLADAWRLSGNLDQADSYYREALRIAHLCQNQESIASFTGNFADIHLDRGDFPGAEILALEALRLSVAVGRQQLIAEDCHRLAKALLGQRRNEGAQGYAQRAIEIYTRLGSPNLASALATLRECAA